MAAVDTTTYQLLHMDVIEDKSEEKIFKFLDVVSVDSNVNYHTDGLKTYETYYKKRGFKHTKTKNKTTQVESYNSILRDIVTPLKRKSKSICRSMNNLRNNIYTACVLYNNKINSFLDFKLFVRIFVSLFRFKRSESEYQLIN